MDTFDSFAARHALIARRGFIDEAGGLSAVGVALLAAQSAAPVELEAGRAQEASREALGWESQAIGYYQDLLESGALPASERSTAVLFQQHHVEQRATLEQALLREGTLSPLLPALGDLGTGLPPDSEPRNRWARAAQLERAGCQSYLQYAATCEGHPWSALLVRCAAQCALHYGALAQLAGEPLEL